MLCNVFAGFLLWATVTFLPAFLFGLPICYQPFGCFEMDSDFFNPLTRPVYEFPQQPEDIQTKFFIYSKRIQSEEQCPGHLFNGTTADPEPNTWPLCLITTEDLLNQTVLNRTLQAMANHSDQPTDQKTAWTAFVVHGWLSSVNGSRFMFNLKNRLLHNPARQYDTVVLVDWSQGADTLYTQACANIRLVGAEIAYFLRHLMENVRGIGVKNIHGLGHSLGAHIAGYAGANFSGQEKLARITAMDPAGLFFDDHPERVRINKRDADFVDVIHTSGFYFTQIGLGMRSATGHIDFYPNGGGDQPGCQTTAMTKLNKTVCNHLRSHELFIYSIPVANQSSSWCLFGSALCSNWIDYEKNTCQMRVLQCYNESGTRSRNQNHSREKTLAKQSVESTCASMGFFAYEWAQTMGLESLHQLNSSVVMYSVTTDVAPYC